MINEEMENMVFEKE